MLKRVHFNHRWLPYMLVAPQMIITLVFFIWPAGVAIKQAFYQQSPFGFGSRFVGLENFRRLFENPSYMNSLTVTVVFSVAVTVATMVVALLLASQADKMRRSAPVYRTLLIWPYAVAPAVAAVLWLFLFQPATGGLAQLLEALGYNWNYTSNGNQALFLVVLAASWVQIPYNFIFYLAALKSIPGSVLEAAAIDGASPMRRFWTIVFPLLSPTSFFLLVMNMVYAFFNTFGVIDALTQGGPAGATETLVYKVYQDGYKSLEIGSAAAQSVILMVIVISLTVIQFRFVDKKVQY